MVAPRNPRSTVSHPDQLTSGSRREPAAPPGTTDDDPTPGTTADEGDPA